MTFFKKKKTLDAIAEKLSRDLAVSLDKANQISRNQPDHHYYRGQVSALTKTLLLIDDLSKDSHFHRWL